MKLAVSGKGGVGKTTVSALLAAALRRQGRKVLAIDADPDSNLLACMGYPKPESVPPLVELKALIEERTGVKPGTTGAMFKINPTVEDIPEKYGVEVGGVRVLVAGAVKKGGTGCYCPENSLLRALISHLLLEPDTALVVDMEAGVEHLGRGTVGAVDRMLVVVEPGRRSIETALRVKKLAMDLGLKRISAVGNKIRSEAEAKQLREDLKGLAFAGFVPFDQKLRDAELAGRSAAEASPEANEAVMRIVQAIEKD